ncbi:MAG TPA: hypothetical protein VHO25_22515 [Polyangiaceae bacterium]|nr:hypothetical protein [Polyangiaceae bacterium]
MIDPYDALDDFYQERPHSNEPPSTEETTVWLLGSGFSKPLGGPLFAELLTVDTHRWVYAWLRHKGIDPRTHLDRSLTYYNNGHSLWKNAEECLALLAEARSDAVVLDVLVNTLGTSIKDQVSHVLCRLSHYVAVATSFFVDRVTGRETLPENWTPYQAWAQRLTTKDTVLTFNYDLVFEELRRRANVNAGGFHKLHGTVPSTENLVSQIKADEPISSLYTPGPSKVAATLGPSKSAWEAGRLALEKCARLIVIGYSFPPTDPFARLFVLKSCKADAVTVVLGPDKAGPDVAGAFSRVLKIRANDTGLLAQQFLAEWGATDES